MENISALILAGKNDKRMISHKTQFSQMIFEKEVIKRTTTKARKN